jgi:hypothetical protein
MLPLRLARAVQSEYLNVAPNDCFQWEASGGTRRSVLMQNVLKIVFLGILAVGWCWAINAANGVSNDDTSTPNLAATHTHSHLDRTDDIKW